MKTTIYLIRHAEAESNTNPLYTGESKLTDIGMTQSQTLAERFRNSSIDAIYTSNILRAQLTAQEIGDEINIEPKVHEFLKEQKGSYDQGLQFIAEETFMDFNTRLVGAKHFLEGLSGKNIVVSHAIFIKALLAYLMLGEDVSEEIIFKVSESLVIDNATISKLIFNKEKGKWRIMSLNS